MGNLKETNDFIDKKKTDTLREVKKKDLFLYFYLSIFCLIIFSACLVLGVKYITVLHAKIVVIIAISLLLYVNLKRFIMGCILTYKAYAPLKIRDRCRYTPTCSTYALISVKKYGIIIGVILAVKRIRRCHPPFCGEDYPTLKALKKGFMGENVEKCRKK